MTTYDLHFALLPLTGSGSQQTTGKAFGFGTAAAVAVAGPQKLINRYLKCLLTEKGSDAHNPLYGTTFSELFSSNVGDLQDLIHAVTVIVNDCSAQIKALDQASQAPADERLHSAVLNRVLEVDGGGITIYLHLKNVAGLIVPTELPTIPTT